jgi:HSP20 family protein
MSNILRKTHGGETSPTTTREWDPLRMMRDFFGYDPFREMAPTFASEPMATFYPSFEVKETKEGYVFKADVPGLKEQDLDVSLTGNRLTVSGKREAEKSEQGETYYTFERTYGSFTRAFTLPDGIDHESPRAELKDGVLTLFVAKKPEVQPKKIDVTSARPKV